MRKGGHQRTSNRRRIMAEVDIAISINIFD